MFKVVRMDFIQNDFTNIQVIAKCKTRNAAKRKVFYELENKMKKLVNPENWESNLSSYDGIICNMETNTGIYYDIVEN